MPKTTRKALDVDATATGTSDVPRFAHLHLHSEYSLLDGGNRISRLINRVKELGMDAVAVTDHGNLYGAAEFYAKARDVGIKPILGIEAYVAPGDRRDKTPTGIADGGFHLVLLAENQTGWQHLLKLSSDAFANGFYYKPRMDKSTLAQWSDGLIAINGHLGSSIAHYLTQFVQTGNAVHYESALEEARWHAKTFGVNENGEPRFYVELQRHVDEQERINPHLVQLARDLDLPLVCDNDAHFLLADDWDVHDTLCCVSMSKLKSEENRLKYPRELYVKSPQEMAELFADVPEAIENSVRIADRCHVDLDFSANHAPVVRVVKKDVAESAPNGDTPVGSTEWFKQFCEQYTLEPFDAEQHPDIDQTDLKEQCDVALRELCEAGLIWRYGEDGITDDIRARLERELKILADKLISAYFLIVWDFVNWARQRGIPASARGSGVGTMVGYVLGLSNACPVKYGLLFERFTDPDRNEYPDIDIDICQHGRANVINYVREKYGHVAQIITFGRLKAKAGIKDVARVMGFTPGEGQRLSNLVPAELNITIDAALEKDADFRSEYEKNEAARRVIDTARRLEDHARHAGIHAAGVVVATQPLDNIVALCKATGSDDIITQWDGPTCEKVGLLKMDFLGLRTLSTIELAKRLIRDSLDDDAIWRAVGRTSPGQANGGRSSADPATHPLDLDRITLDDQKVFELFRRGDTAGIFQFESGGMQRLLRDMKPDRLEDLIAANALYRPGPMDLIPAYCDRKHGKEAVPKVHEIVDGFTSETYGIMVYQEQVMQIVHGLGGIPLRAAYSLIKAISKKKESVIDAERPKFIQGAQEKGLAERQAGELFDLILKFAGYGFNKSHSTGYAIIAYQTAYLKTFFPNQYMAAMLTFESQARKVDDWVAYLEDCKRTIFPDHSDDTPHVGVVVKPPAINLSGVGFTVVFDDDEPRDNCHGHVRFGLSAIKGVGKAAIRSIIEERDKSGPYTSIFDFCERVDLRNVNRATIESLVKSGVFDSIHGAEKRAALCAVIEDAMAAGAGAAADRRSGQMGLFGGGDDSATDAEPADAPTVVLPNIAPWETRQMLAFEKDALGFHVSGHPLDPHMPTVERFCTSIKRAQDATQDAGVAIGGVITRVRQSFTRNGRSAGQKMAVITLQDKQASIDAVIWAETYAKVAELLHEDAIVVAAGRIDRKRGEPNLLVEHVYRIEEAAQHLAGHVELEMIEHASNGTSEPLEPMLNMLAGLLRQHAGARTASNGAGRGRAVPVYLRLRTQQRDVMLELNGLRIVPDRTLLSHLRSLLGDRAVRIAPGNGPTLKEPRRTYAKRQPEPVEA